MTALRPILTKIAGGEPLTRAEAAGAMGVLLRGEAAPEETAGMLVGLAARGETVEELTGFAEAMIGQTVGSQVVVIVPPADGYGEEGEPGSGIEPTDTLVFVIDILAVA